MKNFLLPLFIGLGLLTTGARSAFAQGQTINGQLVVNGNTFIGGSSKSAQFEVFGNSFFNGGGNFTGDISTNNITGKGFTLNGASSLNGQVVINGNTYIGSSNKSQQFEVFGNSFFNGSIGTTKGGMSIDGDIVTNNITGKGLTINGASTTNGASSLNGQLVVNGNTYVGSSTKNQQFEVYGNSYFNGSIGTIKGGMSVDGDIITNNITGKGFTLNGVSTFNGPVQIGNGNALQEVDVNGNVFLHNQFEVDGLTILGGLPSIAVPLRTKYSLFVSKGIVSEDYVIAATSQWADYVFKDSYYRPSLKEVETFINKNKHLEGIPSAAEVAEKGYSMRDVNVTLLRKVEELTLYTIEQDKKAAAQQKELEQLTTQLTQLKATIAELKK